MRNYEIAARQTLHDNGGTFTFDGYSVYHARGYYVGGLVPTAIVRKATDDTWSLSWLANQLARFARQHADALLLASPAAVYLGTWVHDDNVYIDVTEWIGDKGTALRVAAERGELALWDCKAREEVTV